MRAYGLAVRNAILSNYLKKWILGKKKIENERISANVSRGSTQKSMITDHVPAEIDFWIECF
jgi:hypothetical protein